MINLARVMLVFILTISSPNTNITPLIYTNHVNYISDVDDSLCVEAQMDTTNTYGLTELHNLSLFVKYVKTQSNNIDSEVGKTDVYYVIQTMINRMRHDNVDWKTYYKHKSINHSQSITRMKSGSLKPTYSSKCEHDQRISMMVHEVIYSYIPEKYKIDKDVLYFHSFGPKYNRSPHSRDKLNVIARHRFYCK